MFFFFFFFSCLFAGGKKFRTTLDTLTQREPDSMLAAMFSGRHTLCQDPDEVRVFNEKSVDFSLRYSVYMLGSHNWNLILH